MSRIASMSRIERSNEKHQRNDWRCPVCHGKGGWFASQATVCKDEKTFHETPEAVLEALRDSQTGFAVIACPTCGGTGEPLVLSNRRAAEQGAMTCKSARKPPVNGGGHEGNEP